MKILVGLSGGVDSAIAAYLLKQQGHDVTCCFMRNWDSMTNNDTLGNPTLDNEICSQEMDYLDALSVADSLGLKLLRIDFIKEYWDYVFQSFLNDYKRGYTPNPDILCNKYIKFHSFLDYAKKLGFEYMATGHYAKVSYENGSYVMKKAYDLNKDQSYFLSQVPKEALSKTLFPLGEIDKHEVRRIASELKLSIAKKKDSTGICFIGERHFREFLSNYLPMKPGDIIDLSTCKVIGRHQGVLYYTTGQRKGLGIGGSGGPYFVVDKDVYKNELYVANEKDEQWLYSDQCIVKDVNWLANFKVERSLKCQAKFRYRQQDNDVELSFIDETTVLLSYPQKIKAVTLGQQAVFYLDDLVLGGGVISQVFLHGQDKKEILTQYLKDR